MKNSIITLSLLLFFNFSLYPSGDIQKFMANREGIIAHWKKQLEIYNVFLTDKYYNFCKNELDDVLKMTVKYISNNNSRNCDYDHALSIVNQKYEIMTITELESKILKNINKDPLLCKNKDQLTLNKKSIDSTQDIRDQYGEKIAQVIENSLVDQNKKTKFYKWLLNPWYNQQKENKVLQLQQATFKKNIQQTFENNDTQKAIGAYRKIKNDEELQALQGALIRGSVAVLTVGAALGTAYCLSKRK